MQNNASVAAGINNGDKLSAGEEGQRFRGSLAAGTIGRDVNLAGETYETRLTRHETVNERREARGCVRYPADSSPRSRGDEMRRGEKGRREARLSRDSAGNFVNFNLYPCPLGSVHPFKCHANGATNAPGKSR